MKLLGTLLMIFLLAAFSLDELYGFQQEVVNDKKQTAKDSLRSKAIVLYAGSLNKNRDTCTAIFDDYIELKLNNLKYLLEPSDTCCGKMVNTGMVLSINGLPFNDIKVHSYNPAKNSVIFYLARNSESLKKIADLKKFPWSRLKVSDLSICSTGGPPVRTNVNEFTLYSTSPGVLLFTILFILVIVVFYMILVKKTNFIRTGDEKSCFSLAQSQIAFWTLVIAASVLYVWLTTESLPELTNTALTLMGISIVTAGSAKSITFFSKDKNQDAQISEGFWRDILSDATSLTIHRFQMVLWTLILGYIYIQKVIVYQQLPEFSPNYLILTGISSGAYVLLKTVEDRSSSFSTGKDINNTSNTGPAPAMG